MIYSHVVDDQTHVTVGLKFHHSQNLGSNLSPLENKLRKLIYIDRTVSKFIANEIFTHNLGYT